MSEPAGLLEQVQSQILAGGCTQAAAVALAACEQIADVSLVGCLATLMRTCREYRTALVLYERAAVLEPDNAHHHYNRAAARRVVGDLAGAEADYDLLLDKHPEYFEAHLSRSELRVQSPEHNHVEGLETLLARHTPDWRGEVALRYSVAKELEDLGQYARSFDHLRRGALLRRRHLAYDLQHDLDTVQWIIDDFSNRLAAPASPLGPVFIVGLPRTGSTLLERALTNHPDMHAGGELPCFTQALVASVRRSGFAPPQSRRDMVARSATIDFTGLGLDYMRRVRTHGVVGTRFTDKLPLNYLYCGLILRALPHARIIHLSRHPMAAGYAMFKTLFSEGYPFSYDLDEIAGYIAGYRRLMVHWRSVLPQAIYSVTYEDLVVDFAGEMQRILQFCGLPWHDGCAHPDRNAAAETSASAAQVRRPLYSDSLNQWRHYEGQLEPLRQQLSKAGVAPGD